MLVNYGWRIRKMIVRRISFSFFVITVIAIPAMNIGFSDGRDDYLLQNAVRLYFPLSHSMRSLGMGGVWVTLDEENEGLTGNPATVDDRQPYNTFTGNFLFDTLSSDEYDSGDRIGRLREEIYQGLFGISVPLPEQFGKMGIAGFFSGMESDSTYPIDYSSYQISTGWGMVLNDLVSLGYGISFLGNDWESDLADYEMDVGYLHRLGILVGQHDKYQVGAVGLFGFGDTDSNLVGGVHGDGDREMLGVRVGASYRIDEVLLFALDLGYTNYNHDAAVTLSGFSANADENGNCYDIGVGVEYEFSDRFTGRSGLRYQHLDYRIHGDSHLQDLDYVAPTVGLGVKLSDRFSLDAGLEIRPLDETEYTVGVELTAVF